MRRVPAGLKMLLLAAFALVLALLPAWWQSLLAVGAVLLLAAVARVAYGEIVGQLRGLALVAAVIGVAQWVVAGWRPAVDVVATLVALVLAAALVTLTTTTTELTDVVVRVSGPLRRFGVHPERLGLLIAISIRSVAVVADLATEVRDAQRARGRTASPRAFAVPLLVRSLRHAERLGEALVARGLDD